MAIDQMERPTGHVFISYVREDAERVDRLVKVLEGAGIRVWRDTEDLWPGQDWRAEIRRAINKGAFAFIACFSDNSEKKPQSYQNEELVLAIEQLRQRPQDKVWLIPVRFSDSEVPDFNLGAGRTLHDLHHVDLFDNTDWPKAIQLVASISALLGTRQPALPIAQPGPVPASTAPGDVLRSILLDPSKEIEVEDLVNETVGKLRDAMADPAIFPLDPPLNWSNNKEVVEFVLGQIDKYVDASSDMNDVLMRGAAYGRDHHDSLWARVIQRLANVASEMQSGRTALLSIRSLPLCLATYAATLGAVQRDNWGAFRAVTTDAKYKKNGRVDPAVLDASPWLVFEQIGDLAAIALEGHRKRNVGDNSPTHAAGRRYITAPCDYISDLLRPQFKKIFSADDTEFFEAFDKAEIIMGWVCQHEATKADARGDYLPNGYHGSFIWRDRGSQVPLERRLQEEAAHSGVSWPPLAGRMFDGSSTEAVAAAEKYNTRMQDLRQRSIW